LAASSRGFRRREGAPAQMIGQHELGHGLEHRHLDLLALAGARAMEQRRQHRMGCGHPDDAVADQSGHVVRRAAGHPAEDRCDA
jgi:hypothetical protein